MYGRRLKRHLSKTAQFSSGETATDAQAKTSPYTSS